MLNDLYTSPQEITPLTLAVITTHDQYGQSNTYIMEDQDDYDVSHSPTKIVDHACRFFGASLRGRQDGTKDISGITHKAPISIDPASGMYFFPTFSPASPKCSWIAHSHIDKVNWAKHQCTEIIFKNKRRVILEVSYGSVLNQIQRTAQFRYLLDERIKYLWKRNPEQVAEPFA